MEESQNEYMDRYRLSLEILKSIREIDTRISELKLVLGTGPCPGQPERRTSLVERVHRLIETRFCLVYSFLDLNPTYKDKEREFESTNPFDNINVEYAGLKRQI